MTDDRARAEFRREALAMLRDTTLCEDEQVARLLRLAEDTIGSAMCLEGEGPEEAVYCHRHSAE